MTKWLRFIASITCHNHPILNLYHAVSRAIHQRIMRCHQQSNPRFPHNILQEHTDFWAAYRAVIPEKQHGAVGKDTGETAQVERWNKTLRQRLARFVRKTLSFSTSPVMHQACLDLFLHRYNRERVLRLGKMEALR